MQTNFYFKRLNWFVFLSLIVFISGCGVRSISDSGYYADSDRRGARVSNPFYRGELSEFDVLGIDPKVSVTEADIQKVFTTKIRITVPKGSSIMLIQSGAMIPDDVMVKGLQKYYNVSVFTGVPGESGAQGNSYAMALRLAAAKGGYEKMLVYWGLLETGRENLATKVVSWVPIVGWALPDETQRMRIRMKVAIVDVLSGQWDMFSPEPFEDVGASGLYTRVSSDQAQVATLKDKAYKSTVDDLVKRYSR
ncbi:MAG: aminopeptidase [Deltaproteobacteria bacterium]|nr:aminopeptidase [Deltaproteobacteria bacterium]